MSFVNEFASEEDIKNYKLEGVMLRYHAVHKKTGYPYKYKWTIDREKEIYLMPVKSGREERSNRQTWVLKTKGHEIEIVTDRVGKAQKYTDVPYVVSWDLVTATPKQIESLSYEEIISILKEALTVYGDNGVDEFVKNPVVNFNF